MSHNKTELFITFPKSEYQKKEIQIRMPALPGMMLEMSAVLEELALGLENRYGENKVVNSDD